MLTPQFILPIAGEIIVDLFAGGGGASTGIEQAIGRHVDVSVNHDRDAVAMHQMNHPQTQHHVADVFEVDPLEVANGRPIGLLWASPDCKHFSKAKGGKPVSKKIRSLAWVVIKWAKLVRPRVICLENVEEFKTWGPLCEAGTPCPIRKGQTFERWIAQLRNLGYTVEHRELRACDYGAPTIRKRLFLVARCDGQPIVWPEPTHGSGRKKPWRTAAECIDWSVPAPSIFERARPLAEATCRRIAKGIMRYVVDAAEPFIVNTRNGERAGQQPRVRGINEPYWTVTGLGSQGALVSAFLAKHYTGVVGSDLADPLGTATTVDHHSLVAAHLVAIDNQSSNGGHRAATEPLLTTVTENRHALVTSHMLKLRGDNVGSATDEPLHTISAQGTHHAEVRAFLVKCYGTDQDPQLREPLHTVTTRDRFGLVTVKGEPYAIFDIGLRMLTPRELYRAQGFPESYIIDHGADGRPLTKTAQVRMCGNSVCPPIAAALVRANYQDRMAMESAA